MDKNLKLGIQTLLYMLNVLPLEAIGLIRTMSPWPPVQLCRLKNLYMGTSTLSSNHKSTSEGPEASKRGTHIADMPHKTLAKFGVDGWINDVTMSIPINAEQNARRHFAPRGENPSIESSSRTMTCNHSESLEGTYPVAPQWGGTRHPLETSCHWGRQRWWDVGIYRDTTFFQKGPCEVNPLSLRSSV